MNTVKQYRNMIFTIMGFSFIISMTGLILMLTSKSTDTVSVVLTKIGISGVMVAYFLSLYVAVKRRMHIARATQIVLWVLVVLSIPVTYGLAALLFMM
ncbi:MAG: hypothetical protein ABIQ64_02640 [Candidatus Saccharimonadales bacterium]